jgi:tRNA (guanine-N7-)-methyltransferase
MVKIEDIIIEPPEIDEIVDPMSWFATPGPFELEIGCGKGGFLLDRARSRPELRLLGIEWANKYYKFCVDRMARWAMANVRVMRTNARDLVMCHLPASCVTVVHLYHPDPWPKKRHHKRRLVQPDFVDAAIRVLVPGGRWRIQSDHEAYFLHMQELLGQRVELSSVPWEAEFGASDPSWSGTNFEVKYVREGRSIYRAAYARR